MICVLTAHSNIILVYKISKIQYNMLSDWSNVCNMSVYSSEDIDFVHELAYFIVPKYFIKAISNSCLCLYTVIKTLWKL
jgi:hypothetical protein